LSGGAQAGTLIVAHGFRPAHVIELPLTNLSALPGMGTTTVQTNAACRAMPENGSPIPDEWTAGGLVPLLSMITPGCQIMSTTGRLDTMAKLEGLKLRSGAGAQSAAVTAGGAFRSRPRRVTCTWRSGAARSMARCCR
jgi:hypothetical protein